MGKVNLTQDQIFNFILTVQNNKGFIMKLHEDVDMDIIERFKKGNKILIKKLNKGKFTDYCGGKVTLDCILRGKNSSNPIIRKRSTFADNARKWNHG